MVQPGSFNFCPLETSLANFESIQQVDTRSRHFFSECNILVKEGTSDVHPSNFQEGKIDGFNRSEYVPLLVFESESISPPDIFFPFLPGGDLSQANGGACFDLSAASFPRISCELMKRSGERRTAWAFARAWCAGRPGRASLSLELKGRN